MPLLRVVLLLLAAGAIERGALTQRDHAYRRAADLARFTRAAIREEFLVEVTRRTCGCEEVTQGRAATHDGVREDPLHSRRQLRVSLARDLAGGPSWIDAGGEQGLARADVADADDHRVIHQEGLHRRRASARHRPQEVPVEFVGKRLGPDAFE